MKVILDTHTFIWWDSDPKQLSPRADAIIRDPANEVYLSVASAWEMIIKSELGKLTLRLPLRDIITQQMANGIQLLNVTVNHAYGVVGLPPVHKDPFDRMLVAQVNSEGAVLLSADKIFARYPVNVDW